MITKTVADVEEISEANDDGGYSGFRIFFTDNSVVEFTTEGFFGGSVSVRHIRAENFDIWFPDREPFIEEKQ